MKKALIAAFAALFVACGHTPGNGNAARPAMADGVEVLSFHTKKRCPTCVAIERLTREVVETDFAAALADGSLRLRVACIAEEEALADKYEVVWSSLLVVRCADGEERVSDLTQLAFATARTDSARFRAALKAEIEKLLAE